MVALWALLAGAHVGNLERERFSRERHSEHGFAPEAERICAVARDLHIVPTFMSEVRCNHGPHLGSLIRLRAPHCPHRNENRTRCDAQDVCRTDRWEARRIARRGRPLALAPRR